ncbi:MAG: protein kinase [Planctomycetota bacterium]|nr:protein kinase [Planctomycetota bacterium]
MNDPRLLQAQEIGRFLITQGILSPAALNGLLEEYQSYLTRGINEPFQNLLYQRQLISLEQAQYLAQSHSSSSVIPPSPATAPPSSHAYSPTNSSAYMPAQASPSTGYNPNMTPPSSHSNTSSNMIGALSVSSSLNSVEHSKEEMTIGPYTIKGELGKGGQGVVFRAEDHLRTPIAVKLMNSPWASDRAKKRFDREREVMSKLDHPGIVQLIAAGSSPQGDWIAMELIEGEPFSASLRAKRLSITRRLQLLSEVARAVHAAHIKGIVHRDLKPSNVLVSEDGDAKVMDFGLAKQLDQNTVLTQEGAIIGTPYYLAPEQISNEVGKISPATDIYALGVMLFEAMTGKRPFAAETAQGLYHKIMTEPPEAIHKLNPKAPGGLTAVCNKAMLKVPAGRYKTAEDFASDIERVLKGEKTNASKGAFLDKLKYSGNKRALIKYAIVPVILVFMVLAAGFAYNNYRSSATRKEKAVGLAKALKTNLQELKKISINKPKKRSLILDKTLKTTAEIQSFIDLDPESKEAVELSALIRSPKLGKTIGTDLTNRATLQLKNGSVVKALDTVSLARQWLPESDPLAGQAQFIEAEALHATGNTSRSLEILKTLLESKDDKERGQAFELRGRINEERGDLLASAADFKSSSKALGSEGRYQLAEYGRLLAASRQYDESEKVFKTLKSSGDLTVEILISWSRALREQNRLVESSQKLGKATKLAPKDARLRQERIKLLLVRGQLFEALKDLDIAIINDSNEEKPDLSLRLERARLLIELGQLSFAREDLDAVSEGLDNDADFIQSSIINARLLVLEGDSERAKSKLNDALKLSPRHREALKLKVSIATGKDSEYDRLEELLKASPRDIWGLTRSGFLKLKRGDAEGALKIAKVLRNRDKKNLHILLLLARATLGCGDKEQGSEFLKQHATARRLEIQRGFTKIGKVHRLLRFKDSETIRRAQALLRYAYLDTPEDSETLWRLCRYNRQQSLSKRAAFAVRATKLNPYCQWAWQELARRTLISATAENAEIILNAVSKALELDPEPFDKGFLYQYQAGANAHLGQFKEAQASLQKAEDFCGRRFYDTRILIAQLKKNPSELKVAKAQRKIDKALIVKNTNAAARLTPYREGYKAKREDLNKAAALIREAEVIERYHDRVLLTWGQYHLADAEGYSTALYRAVCYRNKPNKVLSVVYFGSNIFKFLRGYGVEKQLRVAATKYNFTEAHLAFITSFYYFLETFRDKDRKGVAKKSLDAANKSLFYEPSNSGAYLFRAHAHAVLGLTAEAEADWQLLSDNEHAATVSSFKVYASIARQESLDKTVDLLRSAMQKGAKASDFNPKGLLGPVREEPAFRRILGSR